MFPCFNSNPHIPNIERTFSLNRIVIKMEGIQRCESLITQTQLLQTSTEDYQTDFHSKCKDAFNNIEIALKNAGLNSMDDLIAQVKAELPEKHATEFQDMLDNMKPTGGAVTLLTGGAKEYLDIGIYLSKMIASCFALHYVAQIRKGLALRTEAFTKIGQAYARTIAQRAVAMEASQLALQAANTHISATELAELSEKFRIGTAEEISIIEEQGGVALTGEEIAVEDALAIARAGMLGEEAIGADAIAAANGLARTGLYGLVASLIIFGAMAIYSSFREDQQIGQLKAMIAKCATSRLYAKIEEATAVSYISLNGVIEDIAEDYTDKNKDSASKQRNLDRFVAQAKNLLPDTNKVYEELFEQDARSGAHLADDPSLAEMMFMHDEEVKARRRS